MEKWNIKLDPELCKQFGNQTTWTGERTLTRTLPREPRGEGYFTPDNGEDQKIKAYSQMYKSLPWNVGGPPSATPPGKSRDDGELFPYQPDLSSSWPNWAGVRRRPSNCPWADQVVFEGCGVKILPSNGHKFLPIDVQRVDVLWNMSLFGNSTYLPLILLVSTRKRWTLMTYTSIYM